MTRVRYLCSVGCISGFITILLGCADRNAPTSQPLGMRQRQEQALRDPYGYNPRAEDIPSISGGGTGQFDKKAFKRDMDSFWNP